MSRFPVCRLLIEPEPSEGQWNMAVDEALLTSAAEGACPTVRWYGWSRPTISLGYFQSLDSVANRWPEGIDIVRRPTGGGAIVHHHEWTYSCTIPSLAPLLRSPYELYDLVHEVLCRAFQELAGITLTKRGVANRAATEPLLCFLREDPRDVCCQGVKVIGSAQRRRRKALLQHGSILLHESRYAAGVPGLVDLIPEIQPRLSQLQASLPRLLAETLGEEVQLGELSPAERKLSEQIWDTWRGTGVSNKPSHL